MKVTVVGAGAVGATCADNIARKELCEELVLLDIKEGIAEGKAQDMMQTAALLGFDTKIVGSTNDYSKTAGSDVVVITSGLPRKPGMTREELIGVNAGIVKGVCENILKNSPNAIIIVISNPMDTMVGGATLTKLIGTSAWYGPGAEGAAMVEAIVRDEKKLFTCCVSLNGEYGQKDICLGVPVIIGKNGWEKILDFGLNADEQAAFNKSADAVRNMNDVLKTL